jgi:hypothetical protein
MALWREQKANIIIQYRHGRRTRFHDTYAKVGEDLLRVRCDTPTAAFSR